MGLLAALPAICILFSVFAYGKRALPTDFDNPAIGSEKGSIHVITSTECFKSYFVYQSLALKYTFEKVGQPGKITRVISCDEEEAKEKLTQEDLEIMDTLVVPNWKQHPITGDYYQPYNRPVSIMFWLAERLPTAEWTLIVDPDMIFKQPFTLEQFHVPEGYAMSSHYNYLEGGNNALADRHIPNVPRKDDLYGGPKGRRADESGAFMFMRTRDLARVAPLWLSFTEAVRDDPDAWNLTGDHNLKKGEKAWISEMYGYVFAAAQAGVRHKVEPTVQYYPGYGVKDIPVLVHYGLKHEVGDYVFSKHQHFDFEPLRCPPWNMNSTRPTAQDIGLILHPPFPEVVTDREPRKKYSLLLVIDFANTINKALCRRHKLNCTAQKEAVERECAKVDDIEKALDAEFAFLHIPGVLCHDDHENCLHWAQRGECERTWLYMTENCRASCQKCRPYHPPQNLSNPIHPSLSSALKTDSDGLEAMQKLRCLQLGLEKMLKDPKCGEFVSRGEIRPEDFGSSHFQIISNSIDASSFFLPSMVTGLVLIVVLTYFFMTVARSRRRKPRPRGRL